MNRFRKISDNLDFQTFNFAQDGECSVFEDRVGVYGKDSSFHNSQTGVKTYSRNLAQDCRPNPPLTLPLLPGGRLSIVLRGNRMRRPKMHLRDLSEDPGALRLDQLLRGQFYPRRGPPL